MPTRHARTLGLVALVAGLAACSESNGDGQINLQFATRTASQAAVATERGIAGDAAFDQVTLTLGDDVLIVNQVELVARKIQLEGDAACSGVEDDEDDIDHGDVENEDDGEHDGDVEDEGAVDDEDGEDCGEIKLPPTLIDLPLGMGAQAVILATVPAGTYDKIKFQIHRPTNSKRDTELLAARPDLANTSIRVRGTFNGTPFTYTTDLTAVQEIELASPLVVAGNATTDLTLLVDVSRWFVTADGTALIDPALAADGQPQASVVEQSIKASFRAFPDEDGNAENDG